MNRLRFKTDTRYYLFDANTAHSINTHAVLKRNRFMGGENRMYTWMRLNFQRRSTATGDTYLTRICSRPGLRKSRHWNVERSQGCTDRTKLYRQRLPKHVLQLLCKEGQHYRADCVRLHFLTKLSPSMRKVFKFGCPDSRLTDHYFGYMVLRPTGIATIGRSVVSPDVRSGASRFIISADHRSISSVIG